MSLAPPCLSICIPTFNRLHYLRESLETLLPQAEELGVDVCVSDNHSTDGTASYLGEMATKYPCLRFITQQVNISLDQNMGAALSMGKGTYLYPLGDDDVIPHKSLSLIVQELGSGADVVIQNGWLTDAALFPIETQLPLTLQGKQFLTPTEAFIALWDKMPFGSFLATRDCFDPAFFKKYLGTSHAYAGAVWQALATKYRLVGECKIRCMSNSAVLLRGGEKSWRNDAAFIFLHHIPKWFSLIMENKEYEVAAKRFRTTFIHDQISVRSLLQYNSMGQLDSRILGLLESEYSPREFSKVKWVAGIPAPVAKFIIQLRKYPVFASRKFLKMIRKLVLGY